MTELICIVCPRGCHLSVDENNGYTVTGNSCPKGAEYGKKELVAPTRVLTSIVKISGAMYPCCPVKTSTAIPKAQIKEAMDLLKDVQIKAPVKIGDVVVKNILGTGADWIATKNFV